MSWTLRVWFAYSDRADPAVSEQFDTKAEGLARANEVIDDGYTTSVPGKHDYFPASAITHVRLWEDPPPLPPQ